MIKNIIWALSLIFLVSASVLSAEEKKAAGPRAALETSKGTIVIELFPQKAPATVANFLSYVQEGFYNETIFHRVIDKFMIQGGGFLVDMKQKNTHPPIKNEADNGLRNNRGTIAMARTQDPNSATAQFFINTKDNDFLNHEEKSPQGWGYAVFGQVVEGMEVVDAISASKTGTKGHFRDVPVEMIIIKNVFVIN